MKRSDANPIHLAGFPHLIHAMSDSNILSIGQCDCAYPAERKKKRIFHSFQNNFGKTPLVSFLIQGDYHASIGKDSGIVSLNSSALNILDCFRNKNTLDKVDRTFRNRWDDRSLKQILTQMVGLGLLVPDSERNSEIEESSDTLSAWLHVTNQCNLRCQYCYVPRNKTDMSRETGKAAVDAVFRSALIHGYEKIQLKYGGGEPLIHFGFVAGLHEHARILADRNNISLDGVVLSNGTLLTETTVRRIGGLGLRLVISLDGPARFHDRCRFYPDGSGSFTDVSNAVSMAMDNGLVPGISITVNSLNIGGLPELMEWTMDRDLPFRINFQRENGASSRTDLQTEEDGIVAGMLKAYKTIESKQSRRSLLGSLGDHASFFAPRKRPCNAGRSYLVFDPLGGVAKCQTDIGKTVAKVDDPDPLGRIRKSRVGLSNPAVDEKPGCRSCEWKHWCAGGCPVSSYRISGRYNEKSPYCNIYKKIFPEIVRLEGLRLLRAGDC